jgi:PAS domain S-box-containing protein
MSGNDPTARDPMPLPLRVLIVEDSPADAELMILNLTEAGFAPDWQRVETEADYLSALESPPDLIVSDWRLPHFSGMRALQLFAQRDLRVPFIIVSGSIGEEAAIDALRRGADDYVLKDRPARLGESVHRALEDSQLRAANRRAEESLRESEEHYRLLTENIKDVVWILDVETMRFRYVSPSVERLRGYTPEEILAEPMTKALTAEASVHATDLTRGRKQDLLAGNLPAKTFFTEEIEQTCKDGSTVWTEVITSYYVNPENGRVEVRGVTRDISERRQAEAALRQQTEALRARNDALSRFNQVAVGRELRMVELKREVNELCEKLGEPPRHRIAEVDTPPLVSPQAQA